MLKAYPADGEDVRLSPLPDWAANHLFEIDRC